MLQTQIRSMKHLFTTLTMNQVTLTLNQKYLIEILRPRIFQSVRKFSGLGINISNYPLCSTTTPLNFANIFFLTSAKREGLFLKHQGITISVLYLRAFITTSELPKVWQDISLLISCVKLLI